MRETKNIDKLFLELSQFTKAKTGKELNLTKENKELKAFKIKATFVLSRCLDALFSINHVHTPEQLREIRDSIESLINENNKPTKPKP